MAEYRIYCSHCGHQGQANSRWVPFSKLKTKDKLCPCCGQALDLTPCCTLRSDSSLPDL